MARLVLALIVIVSYTSVLIFPAINLGNEVYFMGDPPHVLKTLQNAWYNSWKNGTRNFKMFLFCVGYLLGPVQWYQLPFSKLCMAIFKISVHLQGHSHSSGMIGQHANDVHFVGIYSHLQFFLVGIGKCCGLTNCQQIAFQFCW